MEKLSMESAKIMNERFGKDTLITLATLDGDYPAVRQVNGYYEEGAFYVITYALSNKMKQIEKNSRVSICGEWFTARGKGINRGYFGNEDNKEIAEKLRKAFAEWIDNGHMDFNDKNTIILKIELEEGVLFSHGTRYDIDFRK